MRPLSYLSLQEPLALSALQIPQVLIGVSEFNALLQEALLNALRGSCFPHCGHFGAQHLHPCLRTVCSSSLPGYVPSTLPHAQQVLPTDSVWLLGFGKKEPSAPFPEGAGYLEAGLGRRCFNPFLLLASGGIQENVLHVIDLAAEVPAP